MMQQREDGVQQQPTARGLPVLSPTAPISPVKNAKTLFWIRFLINIKTQNDVYPPETADKPYPVAVWMAERQ
jgi:hypothetical protein